MTAGLRASGATRIAPYLTAGDGGLDRTLELLRAVEESGAACVELGVPFSDPIADGPTLQEAAARALAAGTTLDGIERTVRAFRDGGGTVPILAFSYLNPLMSGGSAGALGRRLASLRQAGFDGVLIPDLPLEEAPVLSALAENHGLCATLFCAPTTTDERLARAAEATRGFLYVVGRTGVTGANTAVSHTSSAYLERVRKFSGDTPLGVGFGIRTAEQVAAVGEHAELAIVGSALVAAIHEAGSGGGGDATARAVERARTFMASLVL
ncbi:Tryptophan synthase alpha chain [Planctomycetes bacterium Poly30]|uniref:Tryptophan synthase alpha chain n=2 Tax=Saltatorellus ferox TaxID=2528018 RepID=A0A518EV62_9BACT|nr:Tryptophan synthase alpha chain [Planctomycetes bacterium Poly30]